MHAHIVCTRHTFPLPLAPGCEARFCQMHALACMGTPEDTTILRYCIYYYHVPNCTDRSIPMENIYCLGDFLLYWYFFHIPHRSGTVTTDTLCMCIWYYYFMRTEKYHELSRHELHEWCMTMSDTSCTCHNNLCIMSASWLVAMPSACTMCKFQALFLGRHRYICLVLPLDLGAGSHWSRHLDGFWHHLDFAGIWWVPAMDSPL